MRREEGTSAAAAAMAASHSNLTEEELNGFKFTVDHLNATVDQLEEQVKEVENFYESLNNSNNKGQEKHLVGTKKPLQASKGMQELMHQFSVLLHQITQHKWAYPFLKPVDVEGLGLHDYYEVIDKPMDFSTIQSKMQAKDGSGYTNVREVYSDVRLIFKNAMKYNDEKSEIHVMAKTLLEKIEEKWLLLLPKVDREERRQLEEEARAQLEAQRAQEATYYNMAKDVSAELSEVDMHLLSLKATLVQKCSKLSAHEKVLLGTALTRLSPEHLVTALQIVSNENPNFQPTTEVVDLDLDAQSDHTVWRLNVFVKRALAAQLKSAEGAAGNNNNVIEDKNNSRRRRIL